MDLEKFVVDRTVEELEGATADENACPKGTATNHETEAAALRPEVNCANEQHSGREEMKETIGGNLPEGLGVDIEVMPLEDLMEDDFIERAHQADTQSNTSP